MISHDLYAERPDPVLSGAEIARRMSIDPQIQLYARELRQSDLLVVVHPDWWGGPPALLKGWVDRVFRPGVGYDWEGDEFDEKTHVPLLGSTRLHVFITSDRDEDEPSAAVGAVWGELSRYTGMKLEGMHLFSRMRERGFGDRRDLLNGIRQALETGT